jgi:threonine dehydrogenase-like Zn-dependent dehydrogenase
MRQIIQDLKSGNTILEEVPVPLIKPGSILIRTTRSLVSLGTERMLVEFGKAGYIEKARSEPERVRQVLDKMKTDGILPTLEAVFNKLNQPLPLGYCNVGVVEEVGSGVNGFQVGDRVASNGNHAEYVCVPENLAAKIPENVTDEEACFTVIGSISLQGIRLCNPTFGETIAVAGLGLIGLVTAELLTANGCRVIGYDPDQKKVEIALLKGIKAFNTIGTDPVKFVMQETSGIGTDGVIITASGKSDEIIHQSALMSRKRGRIILVVSSDSTCSEPISMKKNFPSRYHAPMAPAATMKITNRKVTTHPGYVRWTEKRNFEAILHAISSGQLDVKPLITERIKLEDYGQIYGDMRKPGSIASVLVYPEKTGSPLKTIQVLQKEFKKGDGVFGIIGAGNFTSSTIIPAMKAAGANMKSIASAKGLSAKILAKKGNIAFATSDYKEILNDTEIDTVLISTRHDLHASMVIESLKAGKNVFVEKPLCLSKDDLDEIVKVYSNLTPDISHLTPDTSRLTPLLTVGFNRRFSPLAIKRKVSSEKSEILSRQESELSFKLMVHDLRQERS